MDLQQYLIDSFRFNDFTNKKLLEKINELPDNTEAVGLFSHLINSQIKWLMRIKMFPQDPERDWWKPVYLLEELEARWNESMDEWISFLENHPETELLKEINFIGSDGAQWSVQLKDIPLQLIYHSIHHRAQIQTIIRKQGHEPDFVDYIGTKFKRTGK